jgi:hypothetical protein
LELAILIKTKINPCEVVTFTGISRILIKINTMKNIKLFTERGLTESESETLVKLLAKVKPTESDIAKFNNEFEKENPFEHGLTFTDGLVAIYYNLN